MAKRAFLEEGQHFPTAVVAPTWSPDGSRLAFCLGGGWLQMYDHTGLIWAREIGEGGQEARALAWSPDGTTLAAVGGWQGVLVLDPATGKTRFTLSLGQEPGEQDWHSVAWSPDGARLAAGGTGVGIWDVAGRTGEAVPGSEHRMPVSALAFSPGGGHLASGDAWCVRLWSAAGPTDTWQPTVTLNIKSGCLRCLAWSPDGNWLALAIGRKLLVHTAPIPGETYQVYEGCPEQVRALSWSPDGQSLAFGGDAPRVAVWSPFETLDSLDEDTLLARGVAAVLVEGQNPADLTRESLAVTTFAFPENLAALAWSPRGLLCCAGSQGLLRLLWPNQHNWAAGHLAARLAPPAPLEKGSSPHPHAT